MEMREKSSEQVKLEDFLKHSQGRKRNLKNLCKIYHVSSFANFNLFNLFVA